MGSGVIAPASSPAAGPAPARTGTGPRPLAVYVHWPFCLSKCPYCDFNSHVAAAIDQAAWRRAYLGEIDRTAGELGPRRVSSIFFGGGTPSLMDPETAGAIIARILEAWPAAGNDAPEVTLEANPNSAEAARFQAFREAGVNRLSLGVQALDDAALRFLGRSHGAEEALSALANAKRHFARVNADMIYARPGQSEAAWTAELDRLLAEGLGHLALYQLTIERGTPFFAAHRRGDFALPGAEAEAGLYELTGEILGRAGLSAYEVSNYARPGEECRHNLTYWRYGDFAGIGPGAHGRLTLAGGMVATEALRRPEDWIEAVRRLGSGEKARVALGPRERAEEMVMMGLRIGEGVEEARFCEVTGGGFADHLDARGLERLIAAGYLEAAGRRLAATEAGRMRLNAVIAELFPEAGAP